MNTGYFGPPTPSYNNPPINPQYFQPSRFVISQIVTGINTIITTLTPHNYVIGQQVKLLIQPTYGAQQLNQKSGVVISVPNSYEVILDINSQVCNPFITTPSYGPTLPQIIAIGDVRNGSVSFTGRNNNLTTIPGSFINISPN